MINVSQFIVQQLQAWGVTRIYGVAGSETIPLYAAIAETSGIDLITVRHESAAGFMAATEAKCTGKLSVCITTAGPGLTNLLNGIADASQDHLPVLVLSGQIKTVKIGTHFKQYINQQQLISPLALYSETITHPDATPALLFHAMQTALLQKGVTHLSIPADLQNMPVNEANILPYPQPLFQVEPALDANRILSVAHRIAKAQKPMILIGVGAKKAAQHIAKLAAVLGAGIIASLGAKGVISEEHCHHLGSIGDGGSDEAIALLQEADLLLMIGCTWYPETYIPKSLPIIQFDLNPNNIVLQHSIIDYIIGKAESVLPKMLSLLPTAKEQSSWAKRVQSMHQTYTERITSETALKTETRYVHPAHLIGVIASQMPEDGVLIVDTGEHTVWLNRYFTGKIEHILFSGKWRSMGYALPAANAVKLLHPDKTVLAVIGDGSFLMNVGECATTTRYLLPIKVIVFNNQSLILEERKSVQKGYEPIGTELTNPDFVQLATAFGWQGRKVKNESDLPQALQEMMNATTPYLLEVVVSHDMPRDLTPN